MLSSSPAARDYLDCSKDHEVAVTVTVWKPVVYLNQPMQNLENAPANEVCYHWAYTVDLDTWEYKRGLKCITASLLALSIGNWQYCQSGQEPPNSRSTFFNNTFCSMRLLVYQSDINIFSRTNVFKADTFSIYPLYV